MATDKARMRAIAAALLACWFAMVTGVGTLRGQERFAEYDLMMYQRPSLEIDYDLPRFADGLKETWLKALEQPDAELQRMAVDTFAMAHRRGVKGIEEVVPRLVQLMEAPDQRLDVVRAAANTLVVLDARDKAEALQQLAVKHGTAIARIVEPALQRWQSPAATEVWLKRVEDAEAGQTLLILAIDGLGDIRHTDASEPLQKIVRNLGQPIGVRMAAADALGQIHDKGLNSLAKDLIDQQSRPAQLNLILAIRVLQRHEDAETIEQLTSLLDRESTSVQSEALEQLYRIDFNLVEKQVDRFVTSEDVNVRRWCALAMIDKQDAGRIELLSTLLGDVNPTLRRRIAAALIKLAEIPKLHDAVIESTTGILEQDQWQGCEQACVVMARLGHKPSGERMVELLGNDRGDVQVASAWALTQLRAEHLLPDMLEHAESVYEGFRSGQLRDRMPGKSLHLAHLFLAFGDQKYIPADDLMRKYLPKDFSIGVESRAAAAWSVGMLYEDNYQKDLAKLLAGRFGDVDSMEPELEPVRWMCAISLGRMKAEPQLPVLRANAASSRAAYWAIEQITGEPMPPVDRVYNDMSGWFLTPLREDEINAGQ